MSVQISIGNITKRINSTKKLADNDFAIKDLAVLLKDPCSMTGPVFQISRSNFPTAGFYNYAKWGSWYYWIDDIVYLTEGIVEVHTHIDALATFKSDIGNTYGFVVYGDSSHWNDYCDDTRFSPEKLLHTQANAPQDLFGLTPSKEGTIVMTFTQTASLDWMSGTTATSPCGIHTAIMSTSDFQNCIGDLKDFDITAGLSGAGALEVIQAFQRLVQSTGGGSLLDNIQRVVWLPFSLSSIKSAIGSGNYTPRTGLFMGGVLAPNCDWIETANTFVINNDSQFAIAVGDLVTSNNVAYNFLKNDRFMSLQVGTPGGYANIPTERFKDSNYLYYRASFCINDGSWALKISKTSNFRDTLASFSGSVGVNVKGAIYNGPTPSSIVADAGAGIIAGALTIAGGAAIGGALSNVEGGAAVGAMIEKKSLSTGISGMIPGNNMNVSAPSGSYGGGVTSMFLTDTADGFAKMTIYAECWAPKNIDSYTNYCNKYGYPVNGYYKVSDMSGYVQMSGASVDAAGANDSMLSTLNSMLNSGIYYE